MSHFREFTNCVIGYNVYYDVDLVFTAKMIDRMSDTEILSICRWFAINHTDIEIIESIREYGEHAHSMSELAEVVRLTTNNTIRQEANSVLQGRKENTEAQRKRKCQTTNTNPDKYKGFVYLLRADNGIYKIGCTKRPDARIKQLGIQLPYELEVICLLPAQDMRLLESKLHERFNERRVNGEWFQLTESDIEEIKQMGGNQ